MPIKIQNDLPVKEILEKENIFVMDEHRAMHQDIRPIQILILNLMPLKEDTELQLLRSLSNTPLQVDVTFMKVRTHTSKNTSVSHLNKFYQNFEELKEQKFDGLIITGAPVEQMDFEEVDYWEELKAENIGMLLYGSVGTGKTFLASCIGNGLLEKRVPVVSTNFPRLLNLLQETREKQKLLDRLSVYKLLILDDLGVERDSAYAAEQIFNIIDARGSSGLPVIVTTNLTLEELEHPTSMQYARIYDRVLEMCPIRIKLTGDSRRRGNAEKRKKIAQQILLG